MTCFGLLSIFMLPPQLARPLTHGGFLLLALLLLVGLAAGHEASSNKAPKRANYADLLYPIIGFAVIIDQALLTSGGFKSFDGAITLQGLWALFASLSAARIVHFLSLEKRVTSAVLQGAIAGYLMLGLAAGIVFNVMEDLIPGSFHAISSGVSSAHIDFISLNYFAFSCLSTVGFGDIVATNHPGEMLSVIVAVIGPLYLAVVMGLLIARVTASETSAEVEESLEEMR
ncbi:MAG: potassium channel family protein [Synechococcus sp. LacPavin_0920_WC12_MAG_50_7]|nr:potassium channel family protein [Synechococcus sp. LacPavin_0920_WC12_MAG_50_7]